MQSSPSTPLAIPLKLPHLPSPSPFHHPFHPSLRHPLSSCLLSPPIPSFTLPHPEHPVHSPCPPCPPILTFLHPHSPFLTFIHQLLHPPSLSLNLPPSPQRPPLLFLPTLISGPAQKCSTRFMFDLISRSLGFDFCCHWCSAPDCSVFMQPLYWTTCPCRVELSSDVYVRPEMSQRPYVK